MNKLSAELGLSDVGLKMLCKRHDIPTPPQGHWISRHHGKFAPSPVRAGRRVQPRDTDALAFDRRRVHPGSMLRGLRHGRTGFSQVLAALAFIAIAVRAFIPSGYMVGSADDGRILPIVLCSGHEAFLDLATGKLVDGGAPAEDDGQSKQTSAPCVFAVSAHFATPQATAAPAFTHVHADEAPVIRPVSVPGRGLAAPPPWATGPPRTA